MKKTQDNVVASFVTVYSVTDMTTKGREKVCGWLRAMADELARSRAMLLLAVLKGKDERLP